MDWDPHADHLARIHSPTVVKAYKTLVVGLSELFDCRPIQNGYIAAVRFSRGDWNPFDFIPNANDLRCYFRSPLFTKHPYLRPVVKQQFPQGEERRNEWTFLVDNMEEAERLLAVLTGLLRNSIESHPRARRA